MFGATNCDWFFWFGEQISLLHDHRLIVLSTLNRVNVPRGLIPNWSKLSPLNSILNKQRFKVSFSITIICLALPSSRSFFNLHFQLIWRCLVSLRSWKYKQHFIYLAKYDVNRYLLDVCAYDYDHIKVPKQKQKTIMLDQ